MKRIDLHNHTHYCNHATGTIDSYIERAIELGIDIYGFSEHAPMDFDHSYRLGFEQLPCYLDDVANTKRRFGDKIDIRCGLEVDWIEGLVDRRVLDADVDYLIGSVHFLKGWGFDNPEFIGKWKNSNIDLLYKSYWEAIKMMAQSNMFQIVGHIDLIKIFNFFPSKDPLEYALDALDAIAKAQMAIEINSAGLRKPCKSLYPSLEILQAAKERSIAICFGSDAHATNQVGLGYDEARTLAQQVGYSQAVTFDKKRAQLHSF